MAQQCHLIVKEIEALRNILIDFKIYIAAQTNQIVMVYIEF